jgi:hypothetical protein
VSFLSVSLHERGNGWIVQSSHGKRGAQGNPLEAVTAWSWPK